MPRRRLSTCNRMSKIFFVIVLFTFTPFHNSNGNAFLGSPTVAIPFSVFDSSVIGRSSLSSIFDSFGSCIPFVRRKYGLKYGLFPHFAGLLRRLILRVVRCDPSGVIIWRWHRSVDHIALKTGLSASISVGKVNRFLASISTISGAFWIDSSEVRLGIARLLRIFALRIFAYLINHRGYSWQI